MTGREKLLARLRDCLRPQHVDGVEILEEFDEGQVPTGAKRNRLIQRAKGEYVVFVDDDDLVAPNYVKSVMDAIAKGPDVVGINGILVIDQRRDTARRFYHTIKYDRWFTVGGEYFRCPNHINPVRRKIARKVPFLPVTFEEDFAYSMALRPLLRTEVYIEESMYLYELNTRK